MGYWHREARKQLEDLDQEVKQEVERMVKEFEKEGLSHSEAGKVESSDPDLDIWRLKIDADSPEVNHRLLIDELDGKFVYYGVYHRKDAYEVKSMAEILERKYDS